MQAAERAKKCHFFNFLVPGDLDLDLQTRPSEGPNTSSMRIWYKSVQQFPRDISDTKKKTTD